MRFECGHWAWRERVGVGENNAFVCLARVRTNAIFGKRASYVGSASAGISNDNNSEGYRMICRRDWCGGASFFSVLRVI